MSEQSWGGAAKPVKPISRSFGFVTQPFELPARPANDIDIDPLEGGTQVGPVELAVVVDPTFDVRIVRLGQILQGFVAVMVKSPAPDGPADGRQRFRTGRGEEARKRTTSFPQRFPHSEHEPEEGKRLSWKVATPVCILAVNNLRLLRMQHQACRSQSDQQARSIMPAPRGRSYSDR